MKELVGWREWVALPEIGIKSLQCKVDTGAKNSALHAFELESFERDGELWVRFSIHVDESDLTHIQRCEARVIDTRTVTDSSGNQSERFFIETMIKIGKQKYKIQVSLTDRDTMKYNMLLGRTALRKAKFIVDPSRSYLQGKK